MLVAQLTDPHIRGPGELAYRKVDTANALQRTLHHLGRLDIPPDIIVLSGDLVDNGEPAHYAHLRRILDEAPAPVLVMPGNHDQREVLRNQFADHAYLPASGPLNYTYESGPLRLICLDTHVPGEAHGYADRDTLTWLRQTLMDSPARPTVAFQHHPPMAVGIASMDRKRCLNGAAVVDTLAAHSHVLRLACGHAHRAIQTFWRGLPISVAPSASHAVALELKKDSPGHFYLEPPMVHLHQWHEQGTYGYLVTHLVPIGEFDGPYPFFDSQGNLIE